MLQVLPRTTLQQQLHSAVNRDEPFVPASWRQAWQPSCTALYRSVIASRRQGSIGYSVAACSSVDLWWPSRHISVTHTVTSVHTWLINVDEQTDFNITLNTSLHIRWQLFYSPLSGTTRVSLVTGFEQPLQINDYITLYNVHATLYNTTSRVPTADIVTTLQLLHAYLLIRLTCHADCTCAERCRLERVDSRCVDD